MKFPHVAAACVMSSALLAGVAPAGAAACSNALAANALTSNSVAANALNSNALASNIFAPTGSSLGELNGVAVEAVSRGRIDGVEPDLWDKTREIVLYRLSQADPGDYC